MILEFSVKNTFSIREKQTISFEAVKGDETDELHCVEIDGKRLLKFACIYGANAAGKTNMLMALDFYLNFILTSFTDLKPDEPTYFDSFRFDDESSKQPGEFEMIFYAPDFTDQSRLVKYSYSISMDLRKVHSESLYYAPKGQQKLVFSRVQGKPLKWGSDVTGQKKTISDMTRDNCSLICAGAQANNPTFTHLYAYFSKRLDRGINVGGSLRSPDVLKMIEEDSVLKGKIVGLLKSTDFGAITDIEVESFDIPDELINSFPDQVKEDFQKKGEKPKTRRGYLVHSFNGKDYRLPIYKESNGTQKVFELAEILSLASTSADVLIDEIDSSLHQDIVEAILHLFLELSRDSQLIFTTHNQDLLESGLLRDDEVWFCYKTDEGNSIYNSITDFTGIRKEPSRKKLYKAGKFGSLPVIDIQGLKELFSAEEK